ncbi:MAG: hypothetical protein WB714_18975, partial [Candidatus Sulfotelmatobacter sp.]
RYTLSEPTRIDISKLKEVAYVCQDGPSHQSPLYHPVRGHLMGVKKKHCTKHEDCSVVLFGRHMTNPVAGVNFGMLRIKPHFRGNPERGVKPLPEYVFDNMEVV